MDGADHTEQLNKPHTTSPRAKSSGADVVCAEKTFSLFTDFCDLHGLLWDKMTLVLIVIASAFMVRGNPCPVIFHSRTAEETDRRGRRYASLAMTPFLPTFDYPTKIREERKCVRAVGGYAYIAPTALYDAGKRFVIAGRSHPRRRWRMKRVAAQEEIGSIAMRSKRERRPYF